MEDDIVYNAAAHCNAEEFKKILLDHLHLIDATVDDNTPMHNAASHGNVDAIKILMKYGSTSIDKVNDMNETPIYIAAVRHHIDAIKELVKLGCTTINTPDVQLLTPLHHATDNIDTFRCLMEHGAQDSMNTGENDDLTPLHFAIQKGNLDVAQILIDAGCDIDLCDSLVYCEGETAVHYAAHTGDVNALMLFYNHHPQLINIVGAHRRTLMHTAAFHNRSNIIELIVRLGSNNINAVDNFGNSALHSTDQCHSILGSAIETLVKMGFRMLEHENCGGYRPLDMLLHSAEFDGEVSGIKVLRALGVEDSKHIANRNYNIAIKEEEVLEIRRRCYFKRSLMDILCCEIMLHDLKYQMT